MRKKAKILHLVTTLNRGGLENHLLMLCRGLVNKGHEVAVAYWYGQGELEEDFRAIGVRVIRLSIKHKFNPFNIRRFICLICSENPDILHTHSALLEFYGNLAGWIARSPCIVSTKHNDELFWQSLFLRPLHYLMSLPNAAIIAISNHVNRYTKSIGVFRPDNVVTIYYGLDSKAFEETSEEVDIRRLKSEVCGDGDYLIGTVARLEPQKGLEYLIRAVSIVEGRLPNVRVVIVGEGSQKATLTQLARNMGVGGAVCFLGKRNDVPAIMKTLDVFVLSSIWEGFGLVLLEAMAAGKPVIASNVSAIPEIVVHGETGLLVRPKDPVSLAQAIITMAQDRERAVEMGNRGRSRVESEFSVATMIRRTESLYSHVMKGVH